MDTWDWSPFLANAVDTPESVWLRWAEAGVGDGLPLALPTPTAVRAMYRAASLDPVRQVAVLEPALRMATVYDLAVCAVAAGCASGSLPVLVAAARAVADPAFNLLGIQTTTGTATPVLIVHGPITDALQVSSGPDCLGGSTRANATLGRALRLLLRSVGGATPGVRDVATMGQPAKLGLCFAESSTHSPWPPYHQRLGMDPRTNAVTAVGVSGTVEVVHAEDGDPEEIVMTVAGALAWSSSIGSHGLLGGGSPLVALSPEHAHALDSVGYDRAAVQRALWQQATVQLRQVAPSIARRIHRARADAPGPQDAPLRVAQQPSDIVVVVTGGIGVKSTLMPSWGGGTRAITVAIEA